MTAAYEDWIGRVQTTADTADRAPYARLASVLDYDAWPWPAGEAPRLGHWLNFAENCPMNAIGPDGHPPRGGFLPPVSLPRRMWAGGRLVFHAPASLGAPIERRSKILDVTTKTGRSGAMVFVCVEHEVYCGGALSVREEQDIVYRAHETGPAGASPPPAEPPRAADFERRLVPDPVMLFRYSALTWNGHRIHYDAPYARDVEGYPGLVVHGPLTATLLLDLAERATPGLKVRAFSFRARAPLFAGAEVRLGGARAADGLSLFAEDAEGRLAMTAEVKTG
jgi:3-methylfumaryl-CoA hydratase